MTMAMEEKEKEIKEQIVTAHKLREAAEAGLYKLNPADP